MRLIQSIVMATRQSGTDSEWTVNHYMRDNEVSAHITYRGGLYTAYRQGELIAQDDRLEVVCARIAEEGEYLIFDNRWQTH